MRAHVSVIVDRLRSSYWFVPTVMAVGAVVLSVLTLSVDSWLGDSDPPSWLEVVLFSGGPHGARELLSTVAGSMITVAGVVFSITIVVLTLASNQFGPRLLSTFMSDRGNQLTLGTFVAAFLYSLLILRKIRTGETDRVPHLSVAVAMLMAIAGLAVLIYFIHHVSTKIQAPNLIAAVGEDLLRYVHRLYPHVEHLEHGLEAPTGMALAADFDNTAVLVTARSSGYVTAIDLDGLVRVAAARDLVVRVDTRPGTFVVRGTGLMTAAPRSRVDDEVAGELAAAVVQGSRRTPLQDFEYPVQQLVEVAVRSLSPGINDPYTAIQAIDRLRAVLAEVAGKRLSSGHIVDSDGRLRVVVARPVHFEDLVEESLDAIRQSADFHTAVYVRILVSLTDVAGFTADPAQGRALQRQGDLTLEAAEHSVKQETDRATVRKAHARLSHAVHRPPQESTAPAPQA